MTVRKMETAVAMARGVNATPAGAPAPSKPGVPTMSAAVIVAGDPPRSAGRGPVPPVADRRCEAREPVTGTVWLLDHAGSTVLPCRLIDRSHSGMRLLAPAGYGIAEEQRCELRSDDGTATGGPSTAISPGRWGTVVWTRGQMDERGACLELGLSTDPSRTTVGEARR